VQCEASVRHYAARLAQVERTIQQARERYPLKIVQKMHQVEAANSEEQDWLRPIKVKQRGRELHDLQLDYRAAIRRAGVEQRRLRRELRAWAARSGLVEQVNAIAQKAA
jgi:hypothetical protein